MSKITKQALKKIRQEKNAGGDMPLSDIFAVLFDIALADDTLTVDEKVELASARAKTMIIVTNIQNGEYQKDTKKKTKRVL